MSSLPRSATARELNRTTLQRQLLLERQPIPIAEAVHRIVALQAQEPASPYLALWNRVAGFDPAALDAAFDAGEVVKAHLMRVTMHAVEASDYPAFHEAMQPTLRAARLNDRRFTSNGVTAQEADALIPELLAYASEPRSNAQMEAWLEARFGSPRPRVWWAIRHYGPFNHAPAAGRARWAFGPRPLYLAARDQERPGDDVGSLAMLFRRYLEGFGPATLADMATFAFVNRPYARAALERLLTIKEVAGLSGPANNQLYDVPNAPIADGDAPAPPRLLGMWDSTLLAYADRTRMLPAEYRKSVIRANGDVLPTLLVDGLVAGVWRATGAGIEATAFRSLRDQDWEGLEGEARALKAMLAAREPTVYSRYARWWSSLPRGDARLLGS